MTTRARGNLRNTPAKTSDPARAEAAFLTSTLHEGCVWCVVQDPRPTSSQCPYEDGSIIAPTFPISCPRWRQDFA